MSGQQQQPDYLDKALNAIEKQIGKKTGHPVDPTKYASQNEKATDKIRALVEKYSGKKIPAKYSN
ncbi:hypothetical protein LTR08_002840 [Meristemomyces frigidus]|nr:hypothetical protein LTR08_002840 [Meristemomyces frigidus]